MNNSEDNGISFPNVGEQTVLWGYGEDPRKTDKYKAIVDNETSKLYSIVSKDYKLIRHEDAIGEVEKAILMCPDLGEYETQTEFYNDGGRMRRAYKFIEVAIKIQDGDLVNPELHLFNSYDVTWPFMVLLGAFRFVCSNGLVVGDTFLRMRKRHIFKLEEVDLKLQVSSAIDRFESQTDQWKKWAGRRLTQEASDKIMGKMKFGKRASEEIDQRIVQEAQDCSAEGFPIMSIWAFYNVLTWYITHRHVSLNHRVEMERRLRTAINILN